MMRDPSGDVYRSITAAVEARGEQLKELALRIHAHPETAFAEHQAASWLAECLGENGFTVQEGAGGLETAFVASWQGAEGGPTVAILAEYDALPGIGHACGHNLIATGALGAALALKDACPRLAGRILVLGTPAEEGGGGKILMADAGLLEGIDVAMMWHPSARTMVLRGGLACARANLKFFGRPAHAASAPEQGISALDALINTFVAVNSLRQFVRDGVRIHGIITRGGDAPNIVPEYCEARFLIRAPELGELRQVADRVYSAARHAAAAVGATCQVDEGLIYPERNNNHQLAERLAAHLEAMGVEVHPAPKRGGLGSSDIGRVGRETATIHPYIAIAPAGTATHTREFAEAAASDRGLEAMLVAAKAMAMTAADAVLDAEFLGLVRAEFERWRAESEAR